MGDNNEARKRLCERTNSMFPSLNVALNDLLNPTEAFLTRTLIHYLRAFGFRVEPPYNIESDANDISKEKREFLAKLCRQVERILQIQFPTKAYTYIDIIRPTIIKTFNTLDLFLNYYCFCKLHKQEILGPLNEQLKARQSQADIILAKQRDLEKRNKQAAQIKVDLAKCEESIKELHEKLPPILTELEETSQAYKQEQEKFEKQNDELDEIRNQVNRLKDLVLQDGELDAISEEKAQVMAKIEEYKQEATKLEQLFRERRNEWDNTNTRSAKIEQLNNILKPEMINDYKENVKLTEHLEKQCTMVDCKHKSLITTKEKRQLDKCEEELNARKHKYEQDAHAQQDREQDLEYASKQLSTAIDEATNKIATLQNEIDEELINANLIKSFVAHFTVDKYEH